MTIETTAYNEGFGAYCSGQERTANPYPQFSTARTYWFKGWDAAEAKAKENENEQTKMFEF